MNTQQDRVHQIVKAEPFIENQQGIEEENKILKDGLEDIFAEITKLKEILNQYA
ncbi:hypothetical protein [Crocosphaera sp. Alani8]|uniref:hypothetical protein n=1 Tax=Crocosphaera sp. Alani8 TaxID=3038952 RepID=UPI00313BA626